MPEPIVVALIAGVVSLVVAGLANFGAEAYRRHRDATALAAGLAGELSSYAGAYEILLPSIDLFIAAVDKTGECVKLVKMDRPSSPVYAKGVEKLGLLGADLAEEVVFVYSTIEAFRSAWMVAAEYKDHELQKRALLAAGISLRLAAQRYGPLIATLRRAAHSEFLSIEA